MGTLVCSTKSNGLTLVGCPAKEKIKMIYVSTGGFKNQNFNDAVNELSNAGIVAFELTGGKHSDNSLERLTARGKKSTHLLYIIISPLLKYHLFLISLHFKMILFKAL